MDSIIKERQCGERERPNEVLKEKKKRLRKKKKKRERREKKLGLSHFFTVDGAGEAGKAKQSKSFYAQAIKLSGHFSFFFAQDFTSLSAWQVCQE